MIESQWVFKLWAEPDAQASFIYQTFDLLTISGIVKAWETTEEKDYFLQKLISRIGQRISVNQMDIGGMFYAPENYSTYSKLYLPMMPNLIEAARYVSLHWVFNEKISDPEVFGCLGRGGASLVIKNYGISPVSFTLRIDSWLISGYSERQKEASRLNVRRINVTISMLKELCQSYGVWQLICKDETVARFGGMIQSPE